MHMPDTQTVGRGHGSSRPLSSARVPSRSALIRHESPGLEAAHSSDLQLPGACSMTHCQHYFSVRIGYRAGRATVAGARVSGVGGRDWGCACFRRNPDR